MPTPSRSPALQAPSPENITAVVLAGGRARRMQGRDKGLVPLAGRPLVAHVLDALRPQVGMLLINANRHRDDYARLGVPVFADTCPGYAGPLAGMAAALRRVETDWAVIVPCDAPRIAPDLVARLAVASEGGRHRACVARTADGLQPVWCLLHRGLAESLDAFLAGGGRKVAEWLTHEDAAVADFTDADAFLNLNTESELRSFGTHGPRVRGSRRSSAR
ncbi:MAG TPA: molybdenum cofactor guanylyltransferase MobA [Gammaproteobacteria bacterium]|nr:molybdenum cofactor guanylyltransferase MobA [Gammaproteobacteria bacterium]